MGYLLLVFLIGGVILLACNLIGLPAFSVVVAILACVMAGLAGGLTGMVIGTNVYKMNYETAFNRSFLAGAAVIAIGILSWTAVLDLLAGGLTASLVANLWHVSLGFACFSFLVGLVAFVTWGLIVFSKRKQHG